MKVTVNHYPGCGEDTGEPVLVTSNWEEAFRMAFNNDRLRVMWHDTVLYQPIQRGLANGSQGRYGRGGNEANYKSMYEQFRAKCVDVHHRYY